MITVKFFAMLKKLAGVESREYELAGPMTLGELKETLKKDFPDLREILEGRSVFVSVNMEFASDKTVLKDGDEVGLLPPFSGG
ncbi:MAG: MoaD/ThiS family protein [Thermodesulfobacteriota bacterium]